jgi:hypothetical protein
MMIVSPKHAVQIPYEFRYYARGCIETLCHMKSKKLTVFPHLVGHTYDPDTLPSCENALMSARATARLEGGRGNEFEHHVQKIMNPA